MNARRLLRILLKTSISLGILAALVMNLNTGNLASAFQAVSVWNLCLAVTIYLGCQFISAERWQKLSQSMNIHGPLRQFYRLYLVGMFMNLFLPTSVGGDLGKAIILAKENNLSWRHTLLSTLAERGCGLVGLLLLTILAIILTRPSHWQALLPVLLAGLAAAGLITLGFRWVDRHPLGDRLIKRFIIKETPENTAPQYVWPTSRACIAGIGISLVFHLFSIALQLFLLHQLGLNVPYLLVTAVYGLSGLASLLPLSLNGIGLREGSVSLLLVAWAGVPKTLAIAYSLVWLAVLLLATLPGGMLLLKQQLRKA